jgi:hypothetical protein
MSRPSHHVRKYADLQQIQNAEGGINPQRLPTNICLWAKQAGFYDLMLSATCRDESNGDFGHLINLHNL